VQTLPNGLQVVVVLHHEQPSVSMRLLIRAGGASDPKDKHGLANLVAAVLDQGTSSKSATEIADTIDFIGGGMGVGAGTDLSFVNMVVMKDSFEFGMRLLSDVARDPAFAPEEIDRQKQQALSALQVSNEDPGYIADAVFDRLVFGFHPYGLPGNGTPESIASITRDDLVAFHKRFFIPNNAILAVVGDVTSQEAFATAKKVFGDWESRAFAPETFIDPPEPTRRVIVVNKPDAVQTEVRMGHVGIPRKHPDYMALNLATRILGGEGSNRLHQVLRTDRGLTYGAQADMDTLKESGDIIAETNTRSEATAEVVRLMVDEFWRMQRERVSDRELENAKAYMTGSFPLTIETPEAIAMQVLNVVFYELPLEQLQNFRDRVNVVTVDDIQRVARTYFKPDRLSIVLVGNAAAFASELAGVGLPQFETIELADLELTSANFRRGRVPTESRPDASSRVRLPPAPGGFGATGQAVTAEITLASYQKPATASPARELLDRMIAAKGGLERLRAIKTITATATEFVDSTQLAPHEDGAPHFIPRPTRSDTVTYLEYPNRMRQEVTYPDGEGGRVMVSGYDGREYWMGEAQRAAAMPAAYARTIEMKFRRDVIAALLAAHDGQLRVRLLPDVKDDQGSRHQAVELSGTDVDPFVLLVDPATALISKQAYIGPGRDRPLVEELFSDYRPVDGLQIAFRAIMRQRGQQVVDRQVTDVKINTPLDPALFKRPAA
jgi:zinc protease